MGNKEVKEKVLRYAIRGEGNLIIYGQKGLGQKALVREAVHAYTCKGDHSQNCDCLACQNTSAILMCFGLQRRKRRCRLKKYRQLRNSQNAVLQLVA